MKAIPRCCQALSIAILGHVRSHWFSKGYQLILSCILMAAFTASSIQWSPFCHKCNVSSIFFIHHLLLFLFLHISYNTFPTLTESPLFIDVYNLQEVLLFFSSCSQAICIPKQAKLDLELFYNFSIFL